MFAEILFYENTIEGLIIVLGSIFIGISIFKLKKLFLLLPVVQEPSRRWLSKYIHLQRILMLFFLGGYFSTTLTLCMGWQGINTLVISLIFFLSAAFMYMGVTIQGKMIMEMMHTLHVMVPICVSCKKIHTKGEDPNEESSWEPVELFFMKKSEVRFSHGFCPSCGKKAILGLSKKDKDHD